MVKYHFYTESGIACGRVGKIVTDRVAYVTCLNCEASPAYREAKADLDAQREAAFQAQIPRTVVPDFGRVNDDGVMECPDCAGTLWRERPRSLFSYHYVCECCGKSVHPMTETGMCT